MVLLQVRFVRRCAIPGPKTCAACSDPYNPRQFLVAGLDSKTLLENSTFHSMLLR